MLINFLFDSAVSWGIGTVTGPAIGGAFAESAATWRWVGSQRF